MPETSESSTLDRYPLVWIAIVMAVAAVGSSGVIGYRLYQQAMTQQRGRLFEIVNNQAHLIDAMVRQARATSVGAGDAAPPNDWADPVLEVLQGVHGEFVGFGETGEFTLARRDGDFIVFLLSHRGSGAEAPDRVADAARLAEPMHAALAGDSGVMVGLDYRGVRVLAAYHPVIELSAGVVAKVDMAEVNAPFVRTGLLASLMTLALVGVGSLLVGRIGNPMVAKVAESELRFRTLLEQSPAITYVHGLGAEWRSLYLSPRVEETLGFAARDWAAGRDSFLARVHAEDRAGARDAVLEGRASGTGFSVEYRLVADDGREVWVQDDGVVLRDPAGRPTAVQGLLLDITARKTAEVERARLATVLEHVAEAVILTDTDGTIQYVNPAFERSTGYSRNEAVGDNPRLLKSGEHGPEFYTELWETITAGNVWRGRIVNRRKDGSTWQDDATISPILDTAGAITHFVCVTRDVTQQLVLEEQLRHSQKMEVVGQLAGGVAHDFNNLLTGIAGYAELVLSELGPEGQAAADQQNVLDLVGRAARLTRRLLLFSRRESFGFEVFELNTMIGKSTDMLSRMVGEKVEMKFVGDPRVGNVRADADQIEQVLMNLAINARDAMPEGGQLQLETQVVASPAALPDQPSDEPWVAIRVADTGHGMDPATRERIFEPFFTTKEHGEGTGLGLATAYGIVEEHRGLLRVESLPGVGTTFIVYLPLVGDETIDEPSDVAGDVARGTETILVVEDEQQVRCILQRHLAACGYRVLMATSAADAQRLYAQHADEIALLLTDIVMPGLDGTQLYRRLAAQDAQLKVLFISGYSPDRDDLAEAVTNGGDFLQKPFGLAELAARVRRALDA